MSITRRPGKPVPVVALAVAAPALALAAWFVRDAVRDAIVRPAFIAAQWVLLYVHSVPQEVYWLLLVAVGIYTAVRSMRRPNRPRRRAPQPYRAQSGIAHRLLDWTIRAGRNPYYRRRLAELLARELCRSRRLRSDRTRLLETLTKEGVAVPGYLEIHLGEQRRSGWRERLPGFSRKERTAELQRLEEAVRAVEEQVGVHGQRYSVSGNNR